MKTFYTVRDIEDMIAAGVSEIELHDDVVLTDVAREKAIAMGMRLEPMEQGNDRFKGPGMPSQPDTPLKNKTVAAVSSNPNPAFSPTASLSFPKDNTGAAQADLVSNIKAAVVARLGTDKYNDLLDTIIPQVMSQLKK